MEKMFLFGYGPSQIIQLMHEQLHLNVTYQISSNGLVILCKRPLRLFTLLLKGT